jgi:predicted transcriptional regulator
MAKQLVDEHGLNQGRVAEILGISQSAVSKYSRGVRGYVIGIDGADEVKPLINEMVTLLLNQKCQKGEFLQLFCQVCEAVRRTGLMCRFCERSDPKVKIDECDFCIGFVSNRK